MRPLLSQFQTSADISQRRRFFRVWRIRELPRLPVASAYFKSAPYLAPLFSAVDEANPNGGRGNVNAQGVCTLNILAAREQLAASDSSKGSSGTPVQNFL
jgi:hypothetical protein